MGTTDEQLPRRARGRGVRIAVWQIVGVLVAAGTVAAVGAWKLDRHIRDELGLLGSHTPAPEFPRLDALDFTLPEIRTGELVSRSDPEGRPVVLFFGSFTCPRFFDHIPAIRKLYEKYEDRAAFRFVYIREPYHDNLEFAAFLARENVCGEEPRICAGLDMYQIEFPCVRDADGRIEAAYHAYPTRAFLFAGSGDLIWASPSGLITPEGLDVNQAEIQLRHHLESVRP
jgi:hypothetical protein